MVPGIIIIILFAAFDLDEYDGQLGYIFLVIVSKRVSSKSFKKFVLNRFSKV